jgi:hypothetical protein
MTPPDFVSRFVYQICHQPFEPAPAETEMGKFLVWLGYWAPSTCVNPVFGLRSGADRRAAFGQFLSVLLTRQQQ